jgi:hypothetical protein
LNGDDFDSVGIECHVLSCMHAYSNPQEVKLTAMLVTVVKLGMELETSCSSIDCECAAHILAHNLQQGSEQLTVNHAAICRNRQ